MAIGRCPRVDALFARVCEIFSPRQTDRTVSWLLHAAILHSSSPIARNRYLTVMGAVQSLVLSSEGAAAATTLVIAGAVGYRISKMVKPQEEENGEKGEGRTEEDEQTPGGSRSSPDAGKARKKKSKKRAAVPQAAVTGTSDAGAVTSAQVVPGGFDVAAAPNVPTKETSKSKSKGKTKQAPASTGRTGTSPQVGDGGDDDDSSATPSEAPPPSAASASGSKSKKSKKKKKSAPGASPSTSILTLANASSSKTTLSASNPGAVEPSAVLVSNPGTTGAVVRAEETLHGSKSKKPLYSGDASTTEDNEDDGKPFLASLSSSRQQAIGQSRTPLAPSLAMQSGAYPDTDSSWTHVRRGGPHGRRDNSSSGLGQLSTSDAGVVSSVTDDGYPSSSPVAERAEDTEEDEAQEQAQDLGSGTSYVRASGDNTQRKTLAERLLPKPRKTGVEE